MDYDFSQWKELPRISCWCSTFAREELLEEALNSFLMQDYPGDKELVILNDYEEQELVFDHPEVRIFNIKDRHTTLPSKSMDTIERCVYEYLAPWPPDDISLPSRLSRSVERMNKGGPMFHIKDHYQNFQYYAPGGWTILWYLVDGYRKEYVKSYDHGATLYSREAYEKGKHYDLDTRMCIGAQMEIKFKLLGFWSFDRDLEERDSFYIYRRFPGIPKWYNLCMISENETLQEAQKHYEKYAAKGKIKLEPKWNMDYGALSLVS